MGVSEFLAVSAVPYEDGRDFGSGPYEVVRGVLRYAVDPASTASARIVDLELAPRDADGCVRFESDLVVLRPVDTARQSRTLAYSVANRGMVASLPLSRGASAMPGTSGRIEPGDAFLLGRGHSVAWSGWQWDVARGPGMVGLAAPEASAADGQPVSGPVRMRVQPAADTPSVPLVAMALVPTPPSYPPADLTDPGAILTVAERPDEAGRIVPREAWRFGRDVDGAFVADGTALWLDGGFRGGLIYEVLYRTERCPVVGTGLLAMRDAVSWLRWGTEADGNPLAGRIDTVCATGASQSGRLLRHYLFEAMNLDEEGRRVFDGVHVHIAGARRGEFNSRFAQPGAIWRGVSDAPPHSTGAILARQREQGGAPKVIATNSAAEYWRGDAWLAHGDPETGDDLDDPPDVRHYAFAGVDHLGDLGTLASMMPAANAPTALDAVASERALFVALEQWVRDGVEPPPSRVPRVRDATATTRAHVLERLATLPGLSVPSVDALAGAPDALVSAVDDDGNEVAGIRLPQVSVPVATSTGWNVRPPFEGLPALVPDFVGSRLPLPATALEREATGDPRASVEERAGRDDYEARVREAVTDLVRDRLLLADDVEAVVADALRAYPPSAR